ncbi:MAG: HAD-IA family hydrolase [Bacteroidaceae bacterium]
MIEKENKVIEQKKKLIVFDLDGTLINTIADLANSGNYALKKMGMPTHGVEKYYEFVGNGIEKLLERAMPITGRSQERLRLIKEIFVAHYSAHCVDFSTPYSHIQTLLQTLVAAGYKVAVASNKYQKGVEIIIENLLNDIPWSSVFGSREGVGKKPNPQIVFDSMARAGITNLDEVLYVGDSDVDMQTALAAGVDACGVTWGFCPRKDIAAFNPKYLVDAPNEIAEILL